MVDNQKPASKKKPTPKVNLLVPPTTVAPTNSSNLSNLASQLNSQTSTGAPSTSAGALGLSSADNSLLAPNGTASFLGLAPDPTRTVAQAATQLALLHSDQIARIQTQLKAAGILGKNHPTGGVLDTQTKDAFVTALNYSSATKTPVSDYLTKLAASGGTGSSVTTVDPAAARVELQNAYTQYGLGTPTNAAVNQLINQLNTAKANKVDANVTDEAQIMAAQKAGGTNSTTHAQASTNADINKAAAAMGVTLTSQDRSNISAQVLANAKATGSPDVNLLNQLVAQHFRMPGDPSQLTGDAATVRNDLLALNSQYLIPVDQNTINTFVTKGIQNQSYAGSLADNVKAQYEQYLRQQAAIQLPSLAKSTQNFANVTPYAATASYRTQISNVLGLGDPTTVDLGPTSKYNSLLQSVNGEPPTMGDISQKLLNDPTYGYDLSPNGIARGYNIGISLAKSLGINLAGV